MLSCVGFEPITTGTRQLALSSIVFKIIGPVRIKAAEECSSLVQPLIEVSMDRAIKRNLSARELYCWTFKAFKYRASTWA